MTKKEYQDFLIETHFGIVEITVDKYLKSRPNLMHMREDMVSLCTEVFVVTARRYDKDWKATFHTFVLVKMRGALKDYVKSVMRTSSREVQFNEDIDPYSINDRDYRLEDSENLFNNLEEILAEDEMTIVNQNLTGGLTNQEVADVLELSLNTLKVKKKRLKKKLKKLFEQGDLPYES